MAFNETNNANFLEGESPTLKKPVALSCRFKYVLPFLPLGLKVLTRAFPYATSFQIILLKSGLNLGLKKNKKRSLQPGVLPKGLH